MKKIFLFVLVFSSIVFCQGIDSTYIKTLGKDYNEFSKNLVEAQKQEEQIKGILIYLEDRYRKEKQRIDSLQTKGEHIK